jgi:hypothetical protein
MCFEVYKDLVVRAAIWILNLVDIIIICVDIQCISFIARHASSKESP